MTRAVSVKRPTTMLNCVEVWEPFDRRLEFVEKALADNYDENIFFCLHEWGVEHHFNSIDVNLEEFNNKLREKNKFVDIVESSYDLSTPRVYSNIRRHKFPVWFLVESAINRCKLLYEQDQNTNLLTMDKHLLDKTDFSYDFSSLSNKPHAHRCLLMDILAKHDLINKGAISWRPQFPDYDSNYKFEYFDNQTRLLSDCSDPLVYPNHNMIAKECEDSFIQIVSESTYRSVFLTEKTAVRMLNYKPFIVAGAPGFYKLMDKLGFMRYNELFDYSFDDVSDEVQRTEMVVENVLRFSNMSYDKKLQAIQSIRPKLIHNFNLTIRYALDTDKWHPLVLKPIHAYMRTKQIFCDSIVHTYIEIKRLKEFYKL